MKVRERSHLQNIFCLTRPFLLMLNKSNIDGHVNVMKRSGKGDISDTFTNLNDSFIKT